MSDPNEPVVVYVSSSQGEAEMILSLLRDEGIVCMSRMTDRTAGFGDGVGTWGPHEVLVRQSDAATARELLSQEDAAQ